MQMQAPAVLAWWLIRLRDRERKAHETRLALNSPVSPKVTLSIGIGIGIGIGHAGAAHSSAPAHVLLAAADAAL